MNSASIKPATWSSERWTMPAPFTGRTSIRMWKRSATRQRAAKMASGYEKSDDYNGPPPGWRSFVLSAVAFGIIIALAAGFW